MRFIVSKAPTPLAPTSRPSMWLLHGGLLRLFQHFRSASPPRFLNCSLPGALRWSLRVCASAAQPPAVLVAVLGIVPSNHPTRQIVLTFISSMSCSEAQSMRLHQRRKRGGGMAKAAPQRASPRLASGGGVCNSTSSPRDRGDGQIFGRRSCTRSKRSCPANWTIR
jgi:hypothetical protein